MNKTLKKFAIAILVAGATVTATRAPAAVTPGTNIVVLDDVNIAFTIYQQGTANTTDTSLPAKTTKFTSLNLIENLVGVTSNYFGEIGSTGVKTFKLVRATLYSNILAGIPNTVTNVGSNVNYSAVPAPTAPGGSAPQNTIAVYGSLYVVDAGFMAAGGLSTTYAGTQPTPPTAITPTLDGGVQDASALPLFIYNQSWNDPLAGDYTLVLVSSNTFMITNNVLWITNTAVNASGAITGTTHTSVILTNDIVISNAATPIVFFTAPSNMPPISQLMPQSDTQIYDKSDGAFDLGFWTTIVPVEAFTVQGTTAVPTIGAGATLTLNSPVTSVIFTNFYSTLAVQTGGGTAASPTPVLVQIGTWVSLYDQSYGEQNPLLGSFNTYPSIYQETGKGLSSTTFAGTNITAQTEYKYEGFSLDSVWPTNSPPANTTNLYLQGGGLDKQTKLVKSLLFDTARGTAPVSVQVTTAETFDVAGNGFIGGIFSGSPTNIVGTVTNYNFDVPDTLIGVGATPENPLFTFLGNPVSPTVTTPVIIGTEFSSFATYNNFEQNTIHQTAAPTLLAPQPGYYIQGATNVVYSGTITINFSKAYEATSLPFATAPF